MLGKNENDNERSRKFVTELSQQSREFCIIGLTGRVRSGTSDVCDLLTNPDFHTRMDLPASNTDALLSEAREYRVVYRYLRGNWKPFIELSVTDVIISYVLEPDCSELGDTGRSEIGVLVHNTLYSCFSEKMENLKKAVIKNVLAVNRILQYGIKEDKKHVADLRTQCAAFIDKIDALNALYSMWSKVKIELEGGRPNGSDYPEGSAFFFCFAVFRGTAQEGPQG